MKRPAFSTRDAAKPLGILPDKDTAVFVRDNNIPLPSGFGMKLLKTLPLLLMGCSDPTRSEGEGLPQQSRVEDSYVLPFPSGKWWTITRGYNIQTHGGKDSYALDYARGCRDSNGEALTFGQNVTPIESGTVSTTEEGWGFAYGNSNFGHDYGNNITISHEDGRESRYAHLHEVLVDEGDLVSTHTVLGTVGMTGHVEGSHCTVDYEGITLDATGAHLHVALYKNNTPQLMEPMSGLSGDQLQAGVGYWYNREGDVSTTGMPADYFSNGEDPWGNGVNLASHVSPEIGTEKSTEFIWTAIVESNSEPEVSLYITNPYDEVEYEFPMEGLSQESPWAFATSKDMSSDGNFPWRMEAHTPEGHLGLSPQSEIDVLDSQYQAPDWSSVTINEEYSDDNISLTVGEAVHFMGLASSNSETEMTLHILNPNDALVYSFPMDISYVGGYFMGVYEKTDGMRDETVYPFWLTATNEESSNSSGIHTLTTY
jgi:hypothetical protein